MDDPEIFKENVQPLRQGRRISELKAALTNDDNQRESIRQKFENEIKQADNDNDKLFDLYRRYIEWIQQNYPSGCKKIKFSEILEKCIKKFYKNDKYRNDERMLTIFLCYINIVKNPIDVFKAFYKYNFARKLSKFYIEWAYHLEIQQQYKMAIQVLKYGIENNAEPLSNLNRMLNDLEVRTLRFIMKNENDDDKPIVDDNERKALNKLKTIKDRHGNAKAPIKRTMIDTNSQPKKFSSNNDANNNDKQSNDQPFEIFIENNDDNNNADCNDLKENFNDDPKENKLKIEKWTNVKLDLKKVPKNNIKEEFKIYCDDEANENDKNEDKNVNIDEPKYPIVILGDKEKLKGWILYNRMDEIYCDNTEYQLEEIKYKKWLKKQKEKEEQIQKQKEQDEILKKQSIIEKLSTTKNDEFLCNSTKNMSMILATYFNGTLYNTMYQTQYNEQSTIIKPNANQMEKFEIFQDSMLKNPSLTPFQNSVIKSSNKLNYGEGMTARLSPIVEISRESNKSSLSSSSSSSSSTSTISNVVVKKILIQSSNIDPFDNEVRQKILSSISDPVEFRIDYRKNKQSLPVLSEGKKVIIYDEKYIIMENFDLNKHIKLYAFTIFNHLITSNDFSYGLIKSSNRLNYWEFYIYDELKRRLLQNNDFNAGTDIEISVLSLDQIIFYSDGYLTISKNLNFNNSIKRLVLNHTKPSSIPELMILLVALEMILIIKKLHDLEIIHANISAENVILCSIDQEEISALPKRTSFIRLIDFSQAIDMKVLTDYIAFDVDTIKNDSYRKILQSKTWNYQIDYIGLMNCIHIMAYGKDLQIVEYQQRMELANPFEKNLSILNSIFNELLNLKANRRPDLDHHVNKLIDEIKTKINEDKLFEINSYL